MTVVEQIHRDHTNMIRMLKLIDNEVTALAAEERRDILVLEYAMEYMINYTDKIHHAKENVMFRLLKERDPGSVKLVDSIINEHDEIFHDGAEFYKLVQAAEGGDFVLRREIVEKGQKYVELSRAHIHKEEKELLKRVDAMFSNIELENITSEIESAKDPLFEGNVEKEYEDLYKYIINQYGEDFTSPEHPFN